MTSINFAAIACFLNIVLPGSGTCLSTCFANPDPIPNFKNLEQEMADEEDEEEEAAKKAKAVLKNKALPPVIRIDKRNAWSAKDAYMAGLA